MTVANQLEKLVGGVLEGLAAQLGHDGILWDPVIQNASPRDHYAQTSAALAYFVDRGDRRDCGLGALDAWLKLSKEQRGHLPFNRFLLLLLREEVSHHARSEGIVQRINSGLQQCGLKRRYASNNWSLLAQACRLIEASVYPGTPQESRPNGARVAQVRKPRPRQLVEFCNLLDLWTTREGAFIDFPARPGPSLAATPFTYHHKALFLAVVAAWFYDDTALTPRIQKLLDWSVVCWDGGGYAGGLGRSTHALYGDACLLATLVLLGCDGRNGHAGVMGRMASGVIQRLEHQRRDDGLYWLNPAGADGRPAWDSYMYLSVYNAWLAAIVGWANLTVANRSIPACLRPISTPPSPPYGYRDSQTSTPPLRLEHAARTVIPKAQAAPVLKRETTHLTVLISTQGQPPQSFGRSDIELRYSGGVPFHVTAGHRIVVPPPCRVGVVELRRSPALAGWTPILVHRDRLFGLSEFDSVELEDTPNEFRLLLTGRPVPLNRHSSGGLLDRALGSLDWRLLRGAIGRRQALHRRRDSDVSARLSVSIGRQEATLSTKLTLENRSNSPVEFLNPAGHSLVLGVAPKHRAASSARGESTIIATAWQSHKLPSPIPGAFGYCLPALELRKGISDFSLQIGWETKPPAFGFPADPWDENAPSAAHRSAD